MSLQVYGLEDIKFGFIYYNVLAGILARDLFPEPEIVCKTLKTEQRGAISWILEWIVKSLEGVELHQQADEDATTRGELLSALRFCNSRNKVDISPPPPYIVLWSKLIGDWPSIVNGGCRFALQARLKFLDQVRILAKSNITWNHGRILLGLGSNETFYATFGIPEEDFKGAVWSEPTITRRGLRRPSSMEAGMLDFNPTTVNYSTISKFCSVNQRIQRLAILEWGLVNPEKIGYFFDRMKSDSRFRNCYLSVYDALRILYRRIFDEPSNLTSIGAQR